MLFWAIAFELATVVVFIASLLLGEHSRPTLVLLYLPRFPLLVAAVAGALLAPLTRRHVGVLTGLGVAMCLVVAFPVMGLSVSTSRSAEHPIHLVSYNVFFGKLGRPALLDQLSAMPADIMCIQAAYGSLNERLRERFPDRTVRQDGELALVSKFPVRSIDVPPPLPDKTPAMFVKYVIDTPAGALRVINVHPYSPRQALFGEHEPGDNIAQREGQVAAAVAAAKDDVPPFIIAGDTNLPALSAIARRRFSGLTDAFPDVGLGFGFTFPAKRPWMRIDRVLGSDGVRFLHAHVAPLGISDHRAILVDLELAL